MATRSLKASFRSVQGISAGSDVKLAGVKVGTITSMTLNPTTYFADVVVDIDKELSARRTEDEKRRKQDEACITLQNLSWNDVDLPTLVSLAADLRERITAEVAARPDLEALIALAHRHGLPVLVDGFICTVAALVAVRINPGCRAWLLFGHRGAEPGHLLVLDALQAQPLLELGLRLGEGSGAALAVPLLRLACDLHGQMATFAEALVADRSA